jgi:MFS family permease
MDRARRPWLTLIVLCLGTFAVLLDATIVNVALPSVITDLHASLDQALWVVNAYLLVFAALLIVAGRLGDMFGPRRLSRPGSGCSRSPRPSAAPRSLPDS